jgi:MFS family permease
MRRIVTGKFYYGYWLVAVAFVAQFVSVGSQNYVIGSFLKPMTTDLGWTRADFQLSRTVAQFVTAFIGFFIGAYVDRNGGRRLMLIGIAVLGVAMFATSWVQNEWQWLLLNGIALTAGASLAGNFVVNVTLSKWFVTQRGRMVGLASMGVSSAGVFLTPAATVLVDGVGWRMAWRILAVAAVVIMIPVSLMMRRAPEDYGLHPDGRSDAEVAMGAGRAAAADFASSLTRNEAIRTRSFYLIVFGFGFGVLSSPVMLAQTIPYMTDAGYSRNMASLMITLTSIPALVTKPLWGYLGERMAPSKLIAIGFLTSAIALVIIVFAVKAHTNSMVYTGFFLLGFGWGGLIPLQEVVWADYFGRRYLGAVRSAGLPLSLLISASAPFLTTIYFDRVGNYDGAFLAAAGLAVLATVLVLMSKRPDRVER